MFSDDALVLVLRNLWSHIPTIELSIVLDERPDLVQRKCSSGYPLHEACSKGLSLSVIRALVERFLEAVTSNQSDRWCHTPIFLACWQDEPELETIDYLVKADPSCLCGTADPPSLLHWRLSIPTQPMAVWTGLVDWVLKQYPEAADLPDFDGRFRVNMQHLAEMPSAFELYSCRHQQNVSSIMGTISCMSQWPTDLPRIKTCRASWRNAPRPSRWQIIEVNCRSMWYRTFDGK